MIDMNGRVAAIFGLANKRSIAWAIAQNLHAAGAQLAISYQNDRMKQEAEGLIADLPGARAFQCDVSSDAEIDQVFAQLKETYGKLDVLVHSIGFAPAQALHNDFLLTSREDFRIAHDVSVYSLIALTRGAAPLMTDGGSVLTLTYFGAEKVVPHYNVMGVAKAALEATVRYLSADLGKRNIRVNAISAGPLKTLASRGIGGLGEMLKSHAERAPLGRNVEQDEVGKTALFLASTSPPASPARPSTWTAAITSWASDRPAAKSARLTHALFDSGFIRSVILRPSPSSGSISISPSACWASTGNLSPHSTSTRLFAVRSSSHPRVSSCRSFSSRYTSR